MLPSEADELNEAPACEDGCGCASCREREWEEEGHIRERDSLAVRQGEA